MLVKLTFLLYQKICCSPGLVSYYYNANLEDRITSGAPVSSTAKVGIPRTSICKKVGLGPFNSLLWSARFRSPSLIYLMSQLTEKQGHLICEEEKTFGHNKQTI